MSHCKRELHINENTLLASSLFSCLTTLPSFLLLFIFLVSFYFYNTLSARHSNQFRYTSFIILYIYFHISYYVIYLLLLYYIYNTIYVYLFICFLASYPYPFQRFKEAVTMNSNGRFTACNSYCYTILPLIFA